MSVKKTLTGGATASPQLSPRPAYPSLFAFPNGIAWSSLARHIRFPLLTVAWIQATWPVYLALAQAWVDAGYSERMWFTVGTSLVHTLCYVIINGFFWTVARQGWFARYELPRKDPQRPKPELVAKTLREAAIGQTVTGPLTVYLLYPAAKSMGMPGMLDPLPDFATMYVAVLLAFVINDWGFYWTHRLLHTKFLYKRVHKQHHTYIGTIGFAAEYAHWFEVFLSNQLPTIAGTWFFGPSRFCGTLFQIERTALHSYGPDPHSR